MNNYSIAQMNWPARQFGSPINNIVASLSGIYLTVVMSILLEKVELLKHLLIYIGNRTIIILILHFLIFRIIYVLMFFTGIVGLDQLKSQILLPGNNYWYILTIFSILIILLLDYFIQKSDFLAFFLLGRKTPEYEKKIKNILAGIFRLRYKTGRNK